MTTEVRNILLGVVVSCFALGWLCRDAWSQTPDSEYTKQILRLQYTEFCSVVKKPPNALAEAINGAVAQDPKTWLPIVEWWNRIHEQYRKAGCGDA